MLEESLQVGPRYGTNGAHSTKLRTCMWLRGYLAGGWGGGGNTGLTLVSWSPSRQKQKPEQRVSPRLYAGVSGCVGSVTDLIAMT